MSILLGLLAATMQPSVSAQNNPDNWSKLLRYETARAKARFRELREATDQVTITRSEIRTLMGRQGSRMTIFCADARLRYSGKMHLEKFFYVLDVSPAGSLTSNYERGTFGSELEDEIDDDLRKLCHGPAMNLDESHLLKSDVHTSTGSPFKPFINDSGKADRNWLIGYWTTDNEGCAYEMSFVFDSDGTYVSGDGNGTWSFNGSELILRIAKQWVGEGSDLALETFNRPRLERFTIKRTGIDSLKLSGSDRETYPIFRC